MSLADPSRGHLRHVARARATGPSAPCAWCGGPMPPGRRRDALTCGKACRQAKARFGVLPGAAPPAGEGPRRFAYADPPYPGRARRYYGQPEVDHAELVARLCREYPDGWALSTSADALRAVLPLCPPTARVAVWVRKVRVVRARRPLSAWEAVIYAGGRARAAAVAEDLRDVLVSRGRQHSHPGALPGMKPAAFCVWLFGLLGARRGDVLDDLYPGSGAVGRAWRLFQGGVAAAPRDVSAPASATPPRSSRTTGVAEDLRDVSATSSATSRLRAHGEAVSPGCRDVLRAAAERLA